MHLKLSLPLSCACWPLPKDYLTCWIFTYKANQNVLYSLREHTGILPEMNLHIRTSKMLLFGKQGFGFKFAHSKVDIQKDFLGNKVLALADLEVLLHLHLPVVICVDFF